jgi:hypothetical protein
MRLGTVDEAHIRIAYDGDALRSGTMDVRDLAPALMALSDLFSEANKALGAKDSTVQLRLRADFKAGSFEVGLELVQTWVTQLLKGFSGATTTGLANLIAMLGFSGVIAKGANAGLLQLIKKLKGRPVRRTEILTADSVRLVLDDEQIVISRGLATVFGDLKVRKAFAHVLEPLQKKGVDTFEVRTPDGHLVDRVTREDLLAFTPPEPVTVALETDVVLENERERAFTIVSLTFVEGNKWRVYDGQNTISVTIDDDAFIARVNARQESFLKDDVLLCTVRERQTIGSDGLKVETSVIRVNEHRHGPRQQVLDLAPKKPGGDPAL